MIGRTERPSAKKSLGDSGRFFGWLAMSWRIASSQPASASAHNAAPINTDALIFIAHLGDVLGIDALQKTRRLFQVKLRIVRFNAQEKFVVRSALKPLHIKQRMVRLRQFVQRQHSEHRTK